MLRADGDRHRAEHQIAKPIERTGSSPTVMLNPEGLARQNWHERLSSQRKGRAGKGYRRRVQHTH